MFRVDVQISADVLKAITQTAHKVGDLMNKAYDRQVKKLRPRIIEEFRVEPTAPGYPYGEFPWDSERQRRYVMAKLRREDNLPYVRTHAYSQGFDLEAEPFTKGGEIAITHPWEGVRYIGGDDARPFHINRWPQIAEIVVRHEEEITDIMIDTWLTVADPFAGVPR